MIVKKRKKKQKENGRWLFQSSASIAVYANAVKFLLLATSSQWPLQHFYSDEMTSEANLFHFPLFIGRVYTQRAHNLAEWRESK